MQTCPFCGQAESERLTVLGARLLIFPCMFTASVDPTWTEAEIAAHLATDYGAGGDRYFRGVCDRLHLHVTRGPAAEALGARASAQIEQGPGGRTATAPDSTAK